MDHNQLGSPITRRIDRGESIRQQEPPTETLTGRLEVTEVQEEQTAAKIATEDNAPAQAANDTSPQGTMVNPTSTISKDLKVTVEPFPRDGSSKDYVTYLPNLEYSANKLGCSAGLSTTRIPNLPANDQDLDTDAKKLAVTINDTTGMLFFQSFKNHTRAKAAILTSRNANWKFGQSHVIMKKLNKVFKRDDEIGKQNKAKMLRELKMRKGEDPRRIISELLEIKLQYIGTAEEMDEEEMIDE